MEEGNNNYCEKCDTEFPGGNELEEHVMTRHSPRFVNVYEVTRHFGGHEEGGWWYNWCHCVASIPLLPDEKPETVIEFLKPRYVNEGDIYSANGGTEYHIAAEREAAESDSTERPHYE